MKVAALDLGTNSFLCLIAEVSSGQITHVYEDHVKVVRLGQDMNQNRRFHPDALKRASECLREFSKHIQNQNPERVLAMATSAARDASNAWDLFKIGREHNIPIEVIPGGKEAEITFRGATSDLPDDDKIRLVIDVGGGSTEYIVGKNKRVLFGKSLDIGCVRLTEKFIENQPTPADELTKSDSFIFTELEKISSSLNNYDIDQVIAVAGTPTTLAALDLGGFNAKKIDQFILSEERLEKWLKIFAELSVEEKMQQYGLERGRADVILVGTQILLQSLKGVKKQNLQVSTKGVRYGIALELASRTKSI